MACCSEFVSAYVMWVMAQHLGLSAVLCVIGFAMTLARKLTPGDFDARMRVQSYAVWSAVVFTLNVIAFLLMGMQAKSIVTRMQGPHLRQALGFAGLVVLAVICTRMIVVLGYSYLASRKEKSSGALRQGIFMGWCGMRGFVTIATAFALPESFPHRDTVVLTAFSVVLATLVLRAYPGADGKTPRAGPLRGSNARLASAHVTLARLLSRAWRASKARKREPAGTGFPSSCRDALTWRGVAPLDRLRQPGTKSAVQAERAELENLRSDDKIGPNAYLGLQELLDWNELTLVRDSERQIEEI